MVKKEDDELKKNYLEKQYNILKISELHNNNPGGIIIRLKKFNVIDNLEDTRGYDLLDEKNKIN